MKERGGQTKTKLSRDECPSLVSALMSGWTLEMGCEERGASVRNYKDWQYLRLILGERGTLRVGPFAASHQPSRTNSTKVEE